MTANGGLAFWLSYIESRGGLWERAGDSTHVMIPPQLQRRLELPEEFAVTEHADVAREDGVALLAAGHPLLMAAAEDVLSADDAGVVRLAVPAAQPPDGERLLARAREAFHVDHGRIDASGPVERSLRQVLRVGVMVTYTASADDQFQERAECWVDVPTRYELPEQAVKRMRRFAADGSPAGAAPNLAAVPPALAAAHRLLHQAATNRCQVLATGSARAAADAELARADTYYAEVLASLTRRQANASPDRQALLAARMGSVRAEKKRRLAEIEEKYTPQHEVRPYRLHLLCVPALRLPVDVLRGARRFPLVLEWLLPAGIFAPVCCPACGANAGNWPLVAAKTHVGCVRCLSRVAVSPSAPQPSVPAPTRALPAPGHGNRKGPVPDSAGGEVGNLGQRARAASGVVRSTPGPAASRPTRAASPPVPLAARLKPRDPQALSRMGEKLATEFWSVTGQGNLRALRRLCAPDSPAAAAIRLYGISGPATAVGLAAGERPERLTFAASAARDSDPAGTYGCVHAGRARYNYLLRWIPDTRLVAEVLPFGSWVSARLPSPRLLIGSAAAHMFHGLPEPACDLDPVAVRLWRKVPPAHGLPLTLRCLAAWWRISDGPEFQAAHRPSVLAAAVHRMVGYRAGEARVTHDAMAELYRVAATETRAINPMLQARLKLSPEQPW
jgi:hypothetical protein